MVNRSERFLILGGTGMLGHKAYEICSAAGETFATIRGHVDTWAWAGIFDPRRVVSGVDAALPDTVREAIRTVRPTVVINAVGVIKQLKESKDRRISIQVNALFPHLLAEFCNDVGAKLIHLGTDCVFRGTKGMYVETDVSDADDVYGRTKYLGEVDAPPALTLRTSIIGHGIDPNASLIDWFLGQRSGSVRGFTKAIYSGLPTVSLCREILRVVRDHRDLTGLYHVSADPISKYELLCLVRDRYELDTIIEPSEELLIDRSLDSSVYRAATGYRPPAWSDLVAEMHKDYLDHSYYRIAHDAQK